MADLYYRIQWHPAFYAVLEVVKKRIMETDRVERYEFISEYNLGKQPMRIDLVIREKEIAGNSHKKTEVDNEIFRIMKKHNIIEYKSPEDVLTIDDFFKTLAYAFLYKGSGEKVNQITFEDISVSIFCSNYPKKVFELLSFHEFEIDEKYPGIYYVTGNIPMPVQIVVISQLTPEKHSALRILSTNVDKEDVRRFINEVSSITEPYDLENAYAALQASISANYEIYEEIRREHVMCDALERLMKDVIDKRVEDARIVAELEGKKKGEMEGRMEGRIEAIKGIMRKLSYTAEQAMDLLEIADSQRDIIMKAL